MHSTVNNVYPLLKIIYTIKDLSALFMTLNIDQM